VFWSAKYGEIGKVDKQRGSAMTATGVRLWTVDEYYRMAEAILSSDERVELLEGQIILMSAKILPMPLPSMRRRLSPGICSLGEP
jgi:hypothetical protein